MTEKLLLVGVDTSTRYALDCARRLGVKTIVTDYNPPERCPEKRQADEYWMIDVADVDVLEARCRAEGVTGVYAGNNEFCLDQTKELARRLGLPFYASDEGWASARDKLRFKAHCAAVGLDTPRMYPLKKPFDPDVLAQIEYPVIVKPTDACAGKGLSLCRDERELIAGFDRALAHSASKEIVVEQYIEGDEMTVHYYLDGGQAHPVAFVQGVKRRIDGEEQPAAGFLDCRFWDEYMEFCGDKVQALFRRMGCRQGEVFVQSIRRGGRFYFLEFGCRFDGLGVWVLNKALSGYSAVERMVNCALGRDASLRPEERRLPSGERRAMIYFLFCAAGRVAGSEGVDEVNAIEGVEVVMERYRPGDEIHPTGGLIQTAYYIAIVGRDNADMIEKLKCINATLRLYDENGNNLLIPYTDYDALREPKVGE